MMIQSRKAKDNCIDLKANFVNINVGEDISKKYGPIFNSDKERIIQILLILQSNALKFTRNGKVRIICEAIESKNDQFLKISVKDEGVGIS